MPTYKQNVAYRSKQRSKQAYFADGKLALDEVLADFAAAVKEIEGDAQKGLSLWGLEVKGASMQEAPVDTGNLKNSAYMVSGKGGFQSLDGGAGWKTTRKGKPDPGMEKVAREHSSHVEEAKARVDNENIPFIELGYTAYYAEAVHEDLRASHLKVSTEGKFTQIGKAKFLEDPIRAKIGQAPDYIKRFAKR